MAEQGFTMEQIATQLRVSKKTISLDLKEIVTEGNNSKPVKTASNPKGAGRPKGSGAKARRKNEAPAAEAAAQEIVDGTKTYRQVQEQTGFSDTVMRAAVAREEGRREAKAEPEIDPKSLSLTAQEKFEIAIRQHKRKLDAEAVARDGDAWWRPVSRARGSRPCRFPRPTRRAEKSTSTLGVLWR
jgi:hypothetical protein